jgi:hypothetical protein
MDQSQLLTRGEIQSKIKPASTGGWSGNVLFSHRAAPAVSSELKGLTAVFGMGTGVSLSRIAHDPKATLSRLYSCI